MAEFVLITRGTRGWDDEMNGTLTWLKDQIEAEVTARQNAVATALLKASNLSDLSDAATARTNLGLGTAAVENADTFDPAGAAQAVLVAAIQRVNHTGTQPSTTISDFTEAAQDAIAAMLVGASGVTLHYDDAANTLTITGPGTGGTVDPEDVRDIMGVALVAAGLIQITVNDPADTITISTTATQNDTDANLRDRSTHTGTESLDVTTDSATRVAMTPAERTKLSGVAAGATANDTNANLRDRSTHTGTQLASTISDLSERIQDDVAAALVAGTNVTISYDDATGKITINSSGSSGLPNLFMRRIDASTWGPRPTDDPNVGIFVVGADPSPPLVTSGTAGMYAGDIRMREA